jgi:hypothetical protein
VRVQYLGKKTGVSRAKLLGTEIVDFWSDKWGWIATFPILCLLGTPPPWLYRALALLGGAVVASAGVLALMASGWLRHRQPAWLANLRAGFAANDWKRLLVVETAIAPLPWLWETFVIMVAGHAFALSLTPVQAFAMLTAFNVAMVVPSPGNIGSFEAGGTLALVLMGVPKESALAFALVYHLSQVVPSVLCGTGILALEGHTLFGKRRLPRDVVPPA